MHEKPRWSGVFFLCGEKTGDDSVGEERTLSLSEVKEAQQAIIDGVVKMFEGAIPTGI